MTQRLKVLLISTIISLIIALSLVAAANAETIFYSSGIIVENGAIPSYICDIYPWLSC